MAKKVIYLPRQTVLRLILSGAALCLPPVCVRAVQTVELAWSPSISTNVVGYRIYYGTACGNYTCQVTVANTNTATIAGLADGVTYHFAATALDAAGDESPFSNEAVYMVPTAAATLTALPAPATVFRFSISGVTGYQYVVQASTNLTDWADVLTNIAPFIYTEPTVACLPQCFYRAICIQP